MGGWAAAFPAYEVQSETTAADGRLSLLAIRKADGEEVLIDTLKGQYPEQHQVAELKREASLAKRLGDIDGVLQVYALETHGQGNVALIREPFQTTLADYRSTSPEGRLSALQAVLLISDLVRILGRVHDRGVVHKAVTPNHIFIDERSGSLRLGRFSISSELVRERQGRITAKRIEGPLPYISPEQTGRMNRDLDYRSDYYSLGVTFFELLTGRLPFQGGSILEWVRQHITQEHPSVVTLNQEIPQALSAIVDKLLAKNPDQRYQSVAGLLADLKVCETALSKKVAIDPSFTVGRSDLPVVFLAPQKLYGREVEQRRLLRVFEGTAAGKVEFCLVHGYSGVGKSALINEFALPIEKQSGFLVQGKFDQFTQGTPYGSLAFALRSLVQQVLGTRRDRLNQWKEDLLAALSPNAQLVCDLVPDLEHIIGPQPAVDPLGPSETQNRFQATLLNFFRVFARDEHPLVLFLDDLQWSDIPTLEVLRSIMAAPEGMHLLIVGAYRSNEVGPGHPLSLVLNDIRASRHVHEIALEPLGQDAVSEMVADTLRTTPETARPLSDLLFSKAQGNPFFTIELMKNLHATGAIYLDPETSGWAWNLDRTLWSELPDDVVEFVVGNLRQLPHETQEVLQLAACIGGTFDLRTLSLIHERPAHDTARALFSALERHMVIPLHADYKLVGVGQGLGTGSVAQVFNPSYQFSHDRVQQAAYALIDESRTRKVHCSIGRLMLRHLDDDGRDENLINIVSHLNIARSIIDDPAERMDLAVLNLQAGQCARKTAAYAMALDFLKTAEELLAPNAWTDHFDFKLELTTELQQCFYQTGHLAEADRMMEIMLKKARSDFQRAEFLAIRTRQYATLGRMTDSIDSAVQGLITLGLEISTDPTPEDIAKERRLVEEGLAGRPVAAILDAPLADDETALLAGKLMMEIFAAAFLSASGNLFPYLVLKAVNLSLRSGNSPEAAFAYAGFGMLLCGEMDEQALGYEYGQLGLAINEKLGDAELRTRIIYVYAIFVHHWSNHWKSLTPLFQEGIKSGYQSGDLLYLSDSAQDCVIWDPTLDLETLSELHGENMAIVRETGYQDSFDSGTLSYQLIQNFLGRTDSPSSLSNSLFDEQACLRGMQTRKFMTGIANYHIFKVEACFFHGEYAQALEHVHEQDKLIKSSMSLPQLTRYYIVAFLTLVETLDDQPQAGRVAILARLEKDLARMRHWADNCQDNFLHLQLLMEAELSQLAEPDRVNIGAFEAAIKAAEASGFLRDEAVASERAARHLLAQGWDRSAEGYLRASFHLYKRWGAHRKVALLEQEFPLLLDSGRSRRAGLSDPGYGNISSGELDVASVMKASRAISKEMVLTKLLQNILDILLENAGGQWGCFVVKGRKGLEVTALKGQAPRLAQPVEQLENATFHHDGTAICLPVTVINQVLRDGEPIILHDAAVDGAFSQDPYISHQKPGSIICAPVQRGQIHGAVYMENNLATEVFSEERLEVLSMLTAQAIVAIENAGLYERLKDYSRTLEEKVATRTAQLEELNLELKNLADTDGLTGLANRRRFDTYLEECWYRLKRSQGDVSVILFDVDHFKLFNDTYGHQRGDDCLVAIARAVREQIHRPTDMVARYGGEEFVVLLPDTGAEGALAIAEQMRSEVERLGIPHAKSSVGNSVTISLGVASVSPNPDLTEDKLIGLADEALYQAKEAGRNRVRLSGTVA